jgi:hypothetical protein
LPRERSLNGRRNAARFAGAKSVPTSCNDAPIDGLSITIAIGFKSAKSLSYHLIADTADFASVIVHEFEYLL